MMELGLKDWCIRVFFIFLFCFMINRLFFFSPGVAEATSSSIIYPLLKIQKFITDPFSSYFLKKSDIIALHKEIALLESVKDDLQAKIIAFESISDFEQRSQEIRDFAQKYDFSEQQLVQVLLRSFDDAGHFYWVDAGLNKGIACNMIALYKNNIVGRVVQVDQLYSKIALITDKRCKIAASCAHTKSTGIFHGNNDWDPTLEFVPHFERIQDDDLVLSTGQGLVYPQGFAIGKIKNFKVCDVSYKIIVQPCIDLQQLDYVYLVML